MDILLFSGIAHKEGKNENNRSKWWKKFKLRSSGLWPHVVLL